MKDPQHSAIAASGVEVIGALVARFLAALPEAQAQAEDRGGPWAKGTEQG